MLENGISDVLIIGATGLVGSELLGGLGARRVRAIARENPAWLPPVFEFSKCDIFELGNDWNRLTSESSAVIFLAFPTNLDEIESYSLLLQQRIVSAFEQAVSNAERFDLPFLFVSSDAALWAVPSGERSADYEILSTINVYAELKVRCERLLLKSSLSNKVIVRCTPVGFHRNSVRHGFLGKLFCSALDGVSVNGFSNVVFSPVSLRKLCQFVRNWLAYVESKTRISFSSVIHLGSENSISKFQFLYEIFSRFKLESFLHESTLDLVKSHCKRTNDQSFIPSKCELVSDFNVSDVIEDIIFQCLELGLVNGGRESYVCSGN